MGKKFFHGVGYFFCALLIILCIIMIFAIAAFGSEKTVDAFGYNIYIVEADGFKSAPKGSAVLVRKCGILELERGNLVLWRNNDEQPALGYIHEITLSDGVYSLRLNENGKDHIVAESQIIGHAEFSSSFLGQVILFMKTPFGVFCIAVLPCIALILYDIIRACAKKHQSELEVEPQFKNTSERVFVEQQRGVQSTTIGVNSDGRAAYGRKKAIDTSAADQILFELASRQQKKTQATAAQPKKINPGTISSDHTRSMKPEPTAEPKDYPKSPRTAAMGAYSKISENTPNANPLISATVKDKTTQLPNLPKRNSNDAFFSQTSAATGRQKRAAPQIGKSAGESESERAGESANKSAPRAVSGRKSSQILASKSIDDLISDDDDFHDRPHISKNIVDDILADIKKNDKN